MKFFYFLVFSIIVHSNVFPQSKETVYVDEKFEKIDFETYNKRIKSELFLSSVVEKDTTIFKKLRLKEYFGNIRKNKLQLNKLYHQRYAIDSTKIWLIRYTDSLPYIDNLSDESIMGSYYEKMKSDTISKIEFKRLNKGFRAYMKDSANYYRASHKPVYLYGRNMDYLLKEDLRYEKHKKVTLLHFYNFNKGFPVNKFKNVWLKDENEILKNLFSDGQLQYKFLLIYPNGDFHASNYYIPYADQKKYFRYGWLKI